MLNEISTIKDNGIITWLVVGGFRQIKEVDYTCMYLFS